MIIADLSGDELRSRLSEGLMLSTGQFVSRVTSNLPLVADAIALLYDQHTIAGDDFADFHVEVALPRSLRRWLNPQVYFHIDGYSPFNPLPADQAFPMLEWGLNWCISTYCHRHLILHAAVVERHGKALILPAPPGSGKSTLCAALIQHGWRLLSDELAMIDPDTVSLSPLPRPVSLKNASIDVIRNFATHAIISREVAETVKGRVAHLRPPPDSVKYANVVAQPGWVVFPRYVANSNTDLCSLSKARTVTHLVENAFNFSVHGARGFAALAKLVDQSSCFKFEYSSLEDAIEMFDHMANSEMDAS